MQTLPVSNGMTDISRHTRRGARQQSASSRIKWSEVLKHVNERRLICPVRPKMSRRGPCRKMTMDPHSSVVMHMGTCAVCATKLMRSVCIVRRFYAAPERWRHQFFYDLTDIHGFLVFVLQDLLQMPEFDTV